MACDQLTESASLVANRYAWTDREMDPGHGWTDPDRAKLLYDELNAIPLTRFKRALRHKVKVTARGRGPQLAGI